MIKSKARVEYERRSKTLVQSFKARQISFQECMSELEAAFERFLVPNQDELSAVRALVLDNSKAVIAEMTMRPIRLMPNRKSATLAGRVW